MDAVTESTREESVLKLLRAARSHLDDHRHSDAIRACEAALHADPTSARALLLLGLVSFEMDQPAQALTFLTQAQARQPATREYVDALATVHARIGNTNDGLFFAKLATTLPSDPTLQSLVPARYSNFFSSVENAQPHRFRGRAEFLLAHGYVPETIDACEKQLELTPDDIQTQRLLAKALRLDNQTARAIAANHTLMSRAKSLPEDMLELARSLSAAGQFDEAAASYDFLLNRWGHDPSITSEKLSNTTRNPATGNSLIKIEHETWAQTISDSVRWDGRCQREPDPARPLRIAYLCAAFDTAGFPDLTVPVISRHQRQGHTVLIYTERAGSSPLNERLRRHISKWTDLSGIDHETAAEILHGDQIDIAVDLTGHGIGGHWLTLARRPTPLSFAWLPGPLPQDQTIDHRLIAGGTTPATERKSEHLSILAPFAAPAICPDVGPLPAGRVGHLTFGAKLDLTSIGPRTAALWATLLEAVPQSRLLIANALDHDQSCIDRCSHQFTHFGVRDRVDIINVADNFQDDLEFYHYVDVALDGYPVGNLRELYRALWMGVPVLSMAERDGGAAKSALSQLGAAEWAACSVTGYVEAVIALSANSEALARLRSGLRQRMSKSKLTDIDGFTRELETVYRSAWSDWCRRSSD